MAYGRTDDNLTMPQFDRTKPRLKPVNSSDYSDVESDSQLDTTAATVVSTKNLFGERDGENWRYPDYERDGWLFWRSG